MPPPPIDEQNRAQILYRKHDYDGALKIYNTIIRRWTDRKNPPMKMLDSRAATLLKLKRFDDALQDARRMIKEDKTISSGYLRAGQILRAQGLDKQAIKIYEHGLKSILNPEAIELVKDEIVKTSKYIVPDKAKDWIMTVLPAEVLLLIMEKLYLHEMVRLLGVCRLWKTVLTSTPSLWRDLDFKDTRKSVITHRIIQTYVRRSKHGITRIVAPNVPGSSMDLITSKCPHLETFHLFSNHASKDTSLTLVPLIRCRTLKDIDLSSCRLKVIFFLRILDSLPNLEKFRATVTDTAQQAEKLSEARLPAGMKRLWLSLTMQVAGFNLGGFLANASRLESLTLSEVSDTAVDLSHLHYLKNLRLSLTQCNTLPRFPKIIEKIHLRYGSGIPARATMQSDIEECSLAKLTYLDLTHRSQRILPLEMLFQCGQNLREFHFQAPDEVVFEYFIKGVREGRFKHLKTLELFDTEATDQDLETIGRYCPLVDHFTIAVGRRCSGSGIRRLVEAISSLKFLRIRACGGVNADVVVWARERGIRATIEEV